LIKTLKPNSLIIFTTHILNEVEELADQMFILIDGEIRIKENPKNFILSQNASNLEEALSNIKEYVKI
jgi:ABC-type Na+ transport system, ATPase component